MPAQSMIAQTNDLGAYLPVLVLIAMAVGFAVANVVLSLALGPKRSGASKNTPYESGMTPLASARKRFNVRFYIMAMIFLVFDVEIIFLYPWAVNFRNLEPQSPEAALFLGRALFFLLTTVIAYVYAYKKGVFRFD
ncbi:MAG: NADH-quinone oxidoreductase subunit A [Phycisphaeraceae bacterium]|nr:NADH-quinone oxidoreductase subunit A [Phycisphaeraceae bacterium]